MKKQFEISDVALWPNVMSLDQNLDNKKKEIQRIIKQTKDKFFEANKNLINLEILKNYLDPQRDIYYPPKTNQPSLCKAGLHYSIPDNVVGIGLKINAMYQNENQWAMLYHGTKPNHVISILQNGLKPGGGQAHKNTLDPWGVVLPIGVYFSFWLNQSFAYTLPNNPIIFQCFCKNVFVATGFKGYTVCNESSLSRILIPLSKDRSNQIY